MNVQTVSSPGSLLLLGIGLALGVGLLFLLMKYVIAWFMEERQKAPVSAPVQPQGRTVARRQLSGLSWVIATTHRSVSQLIGLVMSFASLIAIVLSVICAVAGIAIISYQQYSNIVLSIIAAGATLILAVLIENISLNALKMIRLANEEIAQAEQAHYQQIVKQMEEQFEEDAEKFAQVNHQTLSKQEVQSMKMAASLKLQARREFEKKRRRLMHEQTRTARHNRVVSIPFAAIGVLFSATAGGLFWHTVLASFDLWLNLTIGTMFALAVSVTFIQGELQKRIKDEAIGEALKSGEMQNVMLKQQSEEMVLEMVVDTMAAVKHDPNTLQEMGQTIKEELKTTIRMLTQQTTSRLVDDAENHPGIVVSEVAQTIPQIEEKAVSKRQRKEPEWLTHPALSDVLKRYPKLQEKVASWRSAGRVSVSILSLVHALNCSQKIIKNRIKNGTLQASSHNPNLVLIASVLDWLSDVDLPAKNDVSLPQNDPITDAIPMIEGGELPEVEAISDQDDHLQEGVESDWHGILETALNAMRANLNMTDEELCEILGLKTLGTARFWKVKARDILAQEQQLAGANHQNGHQREEDMNLDEYTPL